MDITVQIHVHDIVVQRESYVKVDHPQIMDLSCVHEPNSQILIIVHVKIAHPRVQIIFGIQQLHSLHQQFRCLYS